MYPHLCVLTALLIVKQGKYCIKKYIWCYYGVGSVVRGRGVVAYNTGDVGGQKVRA